MIKTKKYPDFITVTCLNWLVLLADDFYKSIIIDSMKFLTQKNRVTIYAFVIMDNHLHIIWEIMNNHKKQDVQRDFLKFTAQQILKSLKRLEPALYKQLFVEEKDRKYQFWERNSLSLPLYSENIFTQKLRYIHNNPVKAKICSHPTEYKYSSAAFYETYETSFDFLTNYYKQYPKGKITTTL